MSLSSSWDLVLQQTYRELRVFPGTTVYIEDMVDWVIRDSSLEPFDTHLTVTTLRSPVKQPERPANPRIISSQIRSRAFRHCSC